MSMFSLNLLLSNTNVVYNHESVVCLVFVKVGDKTDLPSIRTLTISRRMVTVVNKTIIENINVHIGSASFHSG